jgi:hypothetical protein
VDDQELDAAVEECMVDGSDPFAKLHVGGAQWHKAEATLNDVREKHADIVRLERGEPRREAPVGFHCACVKRGLICQRVWCVCRDHRAGGDVQ